MWGVLFRPEASGDANCYGAKQCLHRHDDPTFSGNARREGLAARSRAWLRVSKLGGIVHLSNCPVARTWKASRREGPNPASGTTYHGMLRNPMRTLILAPASIDGDRDCNLSATAAPQLQSEGEQLMSAGLEAYTRPKLARMHQPSTQAPQNFGPFRTQTRNRNQPMQSSTGYPPSRAKAWRGGVDGLRPPRYHILRAFPTLRRMPPLFSPVLLRPRLLRDAHWRR